jgi:hypothetical protein
MFRLLFVGFSAHSVGYLLLQFCPQRYTFFSRCARKIAFGDDFSLKTDKSTVLGNESTFLGKLS